MHDASSQRYWDKYAAEDPLWAVLSFPDKSGGRWTLHEFMKTGEREIALLFQRFAALQLSVPHRRALDFGCGVGRLTQALARRHERVLGVDISPVMIDTARRLNRYPERAEYLCTSETALETLAAGSFDCIYSNIVLQHVAPEFSVRYLNEFFRLLGPGGVLVFQLPSHQDSPRDAEIKAMPDDAYRGAIELSVPPRFSTVAASSEFALTLRVRNASEHTWSQPDVGPLALGNHWLDGAGELMLVQDDARSPLLQAIPPGLEWPVLLTMQAPAAAGTYVCEIDLVHEGVTWFAHKGSATLRLTIQVTPAEGEVTAGLRAQPMTEYPVPEYPGDVVPKPFAAPAIPSKGEFPMHGVPREEVMAIIREHGGRLAYLEEDRRAGPEWISYRYFVVGRERL
jgi:SAM-dependent methyltransferase